ncbi:MAG: hypothetical protein V3S98_02820, partial [Dehalococcoidia bacterium]
MRTLGRALVIVAFVLVLAACTSASAVDDGTSPAPAATPTPDSEPTPAAPTPTPTAIAAIATPAPRTTTSAIAEAAPTPTPPEEHAELTTGLQPEPVQTESTQPEPVAETAGSRGQETPFGFIQCDADGPTGLSAPFTDLDGIGVIRPMGDMSDSHVTPIDHIYIINNDPWQDP